MQFRNTIIYSFNKFADSCGVRDHSIKLNSELNKSGINSEIFYDSDESISKQFLKIKKLKPDLIFMEFTPFGYKGLAGFSTKPISILSSAKILGIPVISFIHEPYTDYKDVVSWPSLLKSALSSAQKIRYATIVNLSSAVITSIEKWAEETKSMRFLNKNSKTLWLPVGSNIETIDQSDNPPKIPDNASVLLWGGLQHPGKNLDWSLELIKKCPEMRIEYFGADSDFLKSQINSSNGFSNDVVFNGILNEKEALYKIRNSRFLCSPFLDGISTRRGTALAALGNALPVLSNSGFLTDSIWSESSPILLANTRDEFVQLGIKLYRDSNLRLKKSRESLDFFRNYLSWEIIIKKLKGFISTI